MNTAIIACIGHKPYGVLAVPCRQCLIYKKLGECEDPDLLSFPPAFNDGECSSRVAPLGEKND